MTKRVFFDGMNLALTRGTGVSTYARVLAREARGLGFETGILHNSLRGLPSSRIAREVAFFDVPPPSVTKPLRVLGQAADLVRDQLGVPRDRNPAGNRADAAARRAVGGMRPCLRRPQRLRARARPVRAVEPHAAGDAAGRARGVPLDLSEFRRGPRPGRISTPFTTSFSFVCPMPRSTGRAIT